MSIDTEKAEVIIIGAGIAGLTINKLLSNKGFKTRVLEKALKPGSRNFYSGVINQDTYENLFGKIDLPIERLVRETRFYTLQSNSFDALTSRHTQENNFIVSSELFYSWLAKENKTIMYESLVTDLIVRDHKVCGVKVNGEEYYSNLVVIAEGLNPLLTKRQGLRKGEYTQDQVFLFVEESINLSSNSINERFNLQNNDGVAIRLFINELFNVSGFGYLYTNKKSITLGLGILLSDLISAGTNLNLFLEELKQHPAIKPLILGGTINSYSSYTLPIGACYGKPLPRLCVDGCLVIGGASSLIDPFMWDLSRNAVLTAKYASEAIIKAKELNDYSLKTLSSYEKLIKENILPKESSDKKELNKLDNTYNLIMNRK